MANHPVKGSSCKVEPIREVKDIKTIKSLLQDKPRDYCLFVLGVSTNLRASDLVRITAGQVRHLKVGEEFFLKEKKTSKPRMVTLNKPCVDAIQRLLESRTYVDHEPIFYSKRGQALLPSSIHRLVKTWCKAIHLKGNFGAHTLRKTFGYHQRVRFRVSVPQLMVTFNHATQRQTLDYLCIQDEEIKAIYLNEIC